MSTTVAVPTFRRPAELARCLAALAQQLELPSEVLVLAREEDRGLQPILSNAPAVLNLRVVTVSAGGLVTALNGALAAAQGEIIAVTDDDAAPRNDWVARICRRFAEDPGIGAVGGRDVVHDGPTVVTGAARVVGRVQWFGRVIGNHHIGVGPAREVEILKGANLSLRRSAVEGTWFDRRLRGAGAQVHNDMAMSLQLRRRGWKLVYDPEIVVDHYPAERFDLDHRGQFNRWATADAAHNETLALLEYLPPVRRAAFAVWALLVGTRAVPGLGHLILGAVAGPRPAYRRFRAAMAGRQEGYRTWRRALDLARRANVPVRDR